MKRFSSIFSLLFLALSCIYPYEVQETYGDSVNVVVDGSIVVGKSADLTLGLMNTKEAGYQYSSVRPDEWWVEDNQGTKYSPVSNTSRTVDLTSAPNDRAYRMVVKYSGRTYSSSFENCAEPPVITGITFDDSGYSVNCRVSLEEKSAGSGYVALSYEEMWKFHTQFMDSYFITETDQGWYVLARPEPDTTRYWCWRYSSSNSETLVDMTHLNGVAKDYRCYTFAKSSDRNHGFYHIKVHARSISEAEYRFRKNLETTVVGYNLFTPNPGEIAGNLRCEEDESVRVFGYVTLSVLSSREAQLDDRYLYTIPRDPEDFIEIKQKEIPYYYYDMNFRPLYEEPGEDMGVHIMWGPLRCVDCVADGGSLTQPSFR